VIEEISHLDIKGFGISIKLTEKQKSLLRDIVLDAKSVYDGYPSRHQSELYLFTKELLRIL